MGILDALGEFIGKSIKENYNNFKRDFDNATYDSERMTDERLIRESMNSSNSLGKRTAYQQELRKRGYGK